MLWFNEAGTVICQQIQCTVPCSEHIQYSTHPETSCRPHKLQENLTKPDLNVNYKYIDSVQNCKPWPKKKESKKVKLKFYMNEILHNLSTLLHNNIG